MRLTTEIAYSHADLEECLTRYAKASGQPMPEVEVSGSGLMVARFREEKLIVGWNGKEWCLKRVVTSQEVGGG